LKTRSFVAETIDTTMYSHEKGKQMFQMSRYKQGLLI